jgi:hypothetical protein
VTLQDRGFVVSGDSKSQGLQPADRFAEVEPPAERRLAEYRHRSRDLNVSFNCGEPSVAVID